METNRKIRQATKQHGVRMWQLADYLGISEATMTRLLRHELPEADQKRLLLAVEIIATERTTREQSIA